jgi:predicted nucleic acid-binding protein
MNCLLDTCVLSEFTRRAPEEKVIRWVNGVEEEKLFLIAITIGEIQRGVEKLPESQRKTELLGWINNNLTTRFLGRILPLDAQTMLLWGSLSAQMEKTGHPMPLMDSLIAAIALQNNLLIVTRNTTDFLPCGAQVVNPWLRDSFPHSLPCWSGAIWAGW